MEVDMMQRIFFESTVSNSPGKDGYILMENLKLVRPDLS